MNLLLEPGFLTLDGDEAHRLLVEVVGLIEDGRHRWLVDDPGAVRMSPLYKTGGERLRRRLEVLLEQAPSLHTTKRGREQVLVRIGSNAQPSFGHSEWHIPWRDARALLSRPLHFLVEDADSDGLFLEVILLRYGGRKLKAALGEDVFSRIKQGWRAGQGDGAFFTIEHTGGRVGASLRRHHGAPCDVPPPVMALVDSDRSWPTAPEGHTAEAARRAAEELSGQCQFFAGYAPAVHATRRRELENYIPLELLEEWARNNSMWPRMTQIRCLSEEQRWYFDLKRGMASCLTKHDPQRARISNPQTWPWKSEAVKIFFCADLADQPNQDTSPPDLTALLEGFGDKVWKAMEKIGISGAPQRQFDRSACAEFDGIIDLALRLL